LNYKYEYYPDVLHFIILHNVHNALHLAKERLDKTLKPASLEYIGES